MQSVADASDSGGSAKTWRRTQLLVSCLVVLGAALASVRVVNHNDSPMPASVRQVSVMTQLACFKTALDQFQLDNGFYPTSTEGLMALLQRPSGATNWHGPYIAALPKDPWGRDYRYECPGKHTSAGYRYDLWSLGGRPADSVIANYDNLSLKPL